MRFDAGLNPADLDDYTPTELDALMRERIARRAMEEGRTRAIKRTELQGHGRRPRLP
jgi:hypothetical protein